jgi:hypothetical protein
LNKGRVVSEDFREGGHWGDECSRENPKPE